MPGVRAPQGLDLETEGQALRVEDPASTGTNLDGIEDPSQSLAPLGKGHAAIFLRKLPSLPERSRLAEPLINLGSRTLGRSRVLDLGLGRVELGLVLGGQLKEVR